MNAKMTRIVAAVVAAGLVTVLAAPVVAGAFPRSSSDSSRTVPMSAKGKSAQERRDARLAAKKARNEAKRAANLTKRIENKLRARKARFDAANANINKRIARVAALADKVEAAGGDVTAVRAKLDEARAKLANANALEDQAVAQMRAVTGAADKRAAFREAKATGRQAVAELKAARFALRDAAHLLRGVIEGLIQEAESTDATGTAE